MKRAILVLITIVSLGSCARETQNYTDDQTDINPLAIGEWDAGLHYSDKNGNARSIDFKLIIDTSRNDKGEQVVNAYVQNGNRSESNNGDYEWIEQEVVITGNDSLKIRSLYFDSWLDIEVKEGELVGEWTNAYRSEDYKMPLHATPAKDSKTSHYSSVYNGKWKVIFSPDSEHPDTAVGEFFADNSTARHTFITSTGDYRYLAGESNEAGISLSTFDGSHAYLFAAQRGDGDTLKGKFWSGNHYETSWIAWRDSTIELPDPYGLTSIDDPETPFDFSFTDLNGQMVSLSDERFKGKPVIVQLMGSWCPNCMDETKQLANIYPRLSTQGVEIISLAFEAADSAKAISLLKRYKENMKVEWPVLYAGGSNKSKAGERLPRLEHVMSYPTTIYLGRDHVVHSIYTGFFGPGTGRAYELQTDRMLETIEEITATRTEN